MTTKLAVAGLAVALVVAGGVWLYAAPSINAVNVSPAYVVKNVSTPVVFTATITDPSLNPAGLNLLKTDATGKTLAIVGVMRDNGMNGDAVANDNTFSYRLTMNEPSIGSSYYRVSAAFRSVLQRSLSEVINVDVWNGFSDVTSGLIVGIPNGWLVTPSVPPDSGISLQLSQSELDDDSITIDLFPGTIVQYVATLGDSMIVIGDSEQRIGDRAWRTLVFRENDTELEFASTLTQLPSGVLFVISKNYPELISIRQQILQTVTLR